MVVGAAWLAGSVPFSNLAARRRADVDLRDVGTGTVSGTALYEVAGFGPLAVAGACDVAKGFVGPLLAGRDRPVLGAVAATAGVAGHNWSPWLRGAGGRGLSVAFGAFLPLAWPGTVVLALGLAGGRLRQQSGLGTFLGAALVVPVVARTHGRSGGDRRRRHRGCAAGQAPGREPAAGTAHPGGVPAPAAVRPRPGSERGIVTATGRVTVVTDSAAALPGDLVAGLGIRVVPLWLVIGDERHRGRGHRRSTSW